MSAVGTRTPFPGFARPHSVSVSIPRCRPAFPPLEIAKARRLAQYGRRLHRQKGAPRRGGCRDTVIFRLVDRSEEHTSELQSLMRISYAVFCLKKKKHHK